MYPECTVNNLFERNKQRSAHPQATIARIFEFAHDVLCESRANKANCRAHAVQYHGLCFLSLYSFKRMKGPAKGLEVRNNGNSKRVCVFPATEFLIHN